MKILEVREGFIKFQAESDICLSSFVQIYDVEKSYIAQVIQLKKNLGSIIGYAKILFIYTDGLEDYDKTVPDINADLKHLSYDVLQSLSVPLEPVIAGKTLDNETNIIIDASAFANNMLVSIDNVSDKNMIIKNLSKQFNNVGKNVLIIDTIGNINAKKYVAGVDFKLPLNTSSLSFMYEDCLNDATADSKSMIVDIFKDLSEYSKTVSFVPFETLKSIVDDMVDNSHEFKLLVLKNKLTKFKALGYFATKQSEADAIDNILNSTCAVIDLSKLNPLFLNRYLSHIYEKLQSYNNTQIILEFSNVITKRILKHILTSKKTKTTAVTHSQFKYLSEITGVFDNYIIKPSKLNNGIFNVYSTFLNAMDNSSYLIVGGCTNYIPIISKVEEINDKAEVTFEKIENNVVNIEAENNREDEIKNEVDDNIEALVEQEVVVQSKTLQEQYNDPSDNELISNIDDKKDAILKTVADDMIQPESINMFDNDDDDDNEYSEEQLTIVEQEQDVQDLSDDVSELELSESLNNSEIDDSSNNIIIENIEKEPDEITLIDESAAEEEYTELNYNSSLDDYSQEDSVIDATDDVDVVDEAPDSIEPNVISLESDAVMESISNDSIVEDVAENDVDSIAEYDDDLTLVDISEDIDPSLIQDIDTENEENANEDSFENDSEDSDYDEPQISNNDEINVEDIKIVSGDLNLEDAPLESIAVDSEDIIDAESSSDEFVELDNTEISPDDILVDIDDERYEKLTDEEKNDQIMKDVDKVYTTRKEDDFSESDLDFIDELNEEDELLPDENDNDGILEEIADNDNDEIINDYQENNDDVIEEEIPEPEILETRNASTTMVPVYDADIPQEDLVVSDPIQQGDNVTHAKYGNGVVEKMIKYGNKTLFAINFDNVGRRLLDPTLAEIKKC